MATRKPFGNRRSKEGVAANEAASRPPAQQVSTPSVTTPPPAKTDTVTTYDPETARALQEGAGRRDEEYEKMLAGGTKTTVEGPLRPTATVQAPTGGYESVQDAEDAQREYYEKNGATSPEIEAYIHNLKNPQAPKPTTAVASATDSDPAAPAGTAPVTQSRKPLTGDDLKSLAAQRRNKRLSERGIPEHHFQLVSGILESGGKLTGGTVDGRPEYVMPDGTKGYLELSQDTARGVEEIFGTDFEGEVLSEQKTFLDELDKDKQNLLKNGGSTVIEEGTPAPRVSTASATIQSMIATMPPEAGGFLQSVFGVFQQRAVDLQADAVDDVELADREFELFNQIAGEMMDQREQVSMLGAKVLQQTAQENKALAEMQRTREMAENEQARALFQVQANAEKRRLEKAHAKRIESMMTRVAVAGGFGSSNKMREIEDADFEGELQISSFVKEMSILDQKFLVNALQIEENYSRNVVSVNQWFANSTLSLMETHNNKIAEIKQLVFGSVEKRNEAYRNARSKLRDGWIDLQDKTLGYINEAKKEAADRALELKKMEYDAQKQTWTHAMNYIDRFGTANKAQLSIYETELGLPAGSLSDQKTLAELRLRKSGGTGGGPGGSQLASYVATLREQVSRAHPEWANSPENIDALVLESTQNAYGGAKNERFRREVKEFVNSNNLSAANQYMSYADPSKGAKPYYVDYKFHPTFEQTVITVGDDEIAGALDDL